MPESSPTTTDYADEHTLLGVDPPTGSRPTIRLRAAGPGVGALIDLTVTGASRLSAMLSDAVTAAVTIGLPTEPEDDR